MTRMSALRAPLELIPAKQVFHVIIYTLLCTMKTIDGDTEGTPVSLFEEMVGFFAPTFSRLTIRAS